MAQSISKANKRDKQRHKAKNGMQISNRGIFIIVHSIVKKSKQPTLSAIPKE
jgi:hypothetical protein